MRGNLSLNLTSHVGRDLLQSAQLFKNEAAVVWEYVVNSLQYMDPGVTPIVNVDIKIRLKEIAISDNGRGMDESALQHFFTMHGENKERRAGTPGRGKFGPGKSAAFGIGKVLEVDTICEGVRNCVTLSREEIEQSTGSDIPLQWTRRNESTDLSNGTTITIRDIFLPSLEKRSAIEYIERNLGFYHNSSPQVAVGTHICEYRMPEVSEEFSFSTPVKHESVLGSGELTIKVATAPLEIHHQGIAITCGEGALVAKETCGIERKQFGAYLFGHIDVPALDADDSDIAPYNITRDLTLNPRHPVVRVLLSFLGSKLEEVRVILAKREHEAKKTEEARRLDRESSKIADILNQDFQALRRRLHGIKSSSPHSGAATSMFGDSTEGSDLEDLWVNGQDEPGTLPEHSIARKTSGGSGRPDPEVTVVGEPNKDGEQSLSPAGGKGKKRKKPSGGFQVKYRHLGENQHRSKYDRNQMEIIINLDHPVLKAARRTGSIEDAAFRRLSYEIAFTEYAFALGYEFLAQDPQMPGDDLMFEVRGTLNRISAGAAALYS